MKRFLLPIIAYLIVCMIAVLIPASEGYDMIGWKLFVGQIYAIPVFIIVATVMFFVKRKSK